MDEFYEKYQLDSEWFIKQTGRPDADERIIAFYESLHEAIITDDEDWYIKGYDFIRAMLSNNATELLIGLCGWGPANLARRVFLKRGCPQYCDEELHCTLNVDWSDNARTSASCVVRHADHKVYDFDYGVFKRNDAPAATITNVFVHFIPFEDGNEYDFQCVSQAERDATGDEEIFWYAPENN